MSVKMRLLRFVLIFLVFARPNTCFDPSSVFAVVQQRVGSAIDNSRFKEHIVKTIWSVGLVIFSSVTASLSTWYYTHGDKPLDVFPKVNVLPDPPHDFIVLREKTLDYLQGMVRKFEDKDGKVNTIYMVGSQGTGKTELARQYGNFEFDRNLTRTVVHLNMISETVFKESLIKVINKIELQTGACSGGLIDCRKKLRQGTVTDLMTTLQILLINRPDWLLIVDGIKKRNVTEYGIYKMLPQPGSRGWGTGRMIVTTRLKLAPYDSEHVQIFRRQGLDIGDAEKLLYLVTGGSSRTSSSLCIEHIAYKLHKSPQDIVNVGLFIRNCEILDKINPSLDSSRKMPCHPYAVSDIIFGTGCNFPVS